MDTMNLLQVVFLFVLGITYLDLTRSCILHGFRYVSNPNQMMRAANPRKFRPARPTNSQQIRISRPNSSSGDLEQKSKSLKDINLFRANVLVFPLQASVFLCFQRRQKGKIDLIYLSSRQIYLQKREILDQCASFIDR